MSDIPRLVGMIHLLPLPGAPRFGGSMDEVISTAAADARDLADAGFPALMIENFGDAPFFADEAPAETIASMTVAVHVVAEQAGLPFGVNVLRNDARSAIALAAATGARFIRVNVLTGMMYTDQGPIVGRAAEVHRVRTSLSPEVEIWADVMVKHATPPPGADVRQMAADTVERGLADAVIVSGSGTGAEPDIHEASLVRSAIPDSTRLVIGSGATSSNLPRLLDIADSVIVGSSIKIDGLATNRIDPSRGAAFVEAASQHGLI